MSVGGSPDCDPAPFGPGSSKAVFAAVAVLPFISLNRCSPGRVYALYLNVLTIRQRCEWLVRQRGLVALYAKQELSAQAFESRALIYTMDAAVTEKFPLRAIRFWRQKQGGGPNPQPGHQAAGRLPAEIAVPHVAKR